MSAIDNFKLNFDCPICLESLKEDVVSLNCSGHHKMHLKCAIDIFGEMKAGKISEAKPCPFRCEKDVTSYATDFFFPKLSTKVNEIHDSIWPIIDNFKCPNCDEFLENRVFTLFCSRQHKLCGNCTDKLTSQMPQDGILRCPKYLCWEIITGYKQEKQFQGIVKEAKKIFEKEQKEEQKRKNDNYIKYRKKRMK